MSMGEKYEIQENMEITPEWTRPNLENERGEIERAIREFLSEEPTKENIDRIIRVLERAPLSDLSDEEWSMLENTDSFHNVRAGRIEDAEHLTEEYNRELPPKDKRDFGGLLSAFKQGGVMEAPTILRNKGILHLVSGNTRLMIAHGLNNQPKVVIGDIG